MRLLLACFILSCICCKPRTPSIEYVESDVEATAFEDPPEWSKEVVWYQIFVERFRNGDPTNDPRPADMEGSYPGYIPPDWTPTPWTQDWYKEDPYFTQLKGQTDFTGNPVQHFGQMAQLRRYGGDLQGVLDKIAYLDSLGVTAIYFNPLNDAPSLHKYDARHWRHIDRNFGPHPDKDIRTMANETPEDPATWKFTEADKLFLKVIRAFHERGIKVILDYSWNHTGHTFWAWKDLVEKQALSEYADWYWVTKFDDPDTEANEFEYRGWAGVADLPEIKETATQDHTGPVTGFEGNIYHPKAKQHILNITRRWLDPNGDGDPSDGVDGFRLDVAAEVPLGFWREYRKFVRDINPDAFLLGEVWWKKWPDDLLDPEPFVRGDVFDAPMNYRWYRSARHFFNASPDTISVSEFVDSLNSYRSNLRPQTNYAMMNLTSSHDVPRLGTSLFNKNKYKYNTSPMADDGYKIHKPDEATYQTLRLLLVHQFTYIGAPHIWAGDEMGMWGADDPSTRKPLIWPDYQFDIEITHPMGHSRPENSVRFAHDLFQYYRQLIIIRKTNPVFFHGNIEFLMIDDEKDILTYRRSYGTDEAIVVFNTSREERNINLPNESNRIYVESLNSIEISKQGNIISFKLPARSAAILINEP